MTGAISEHEPDHLTEIVERHEVSVMVGPQQLTEEARAGIIARCRAVAEQWGETNGLGLRMSSFERLASHQDGPAVGVSWEVVVGRGSSDPDADGQQWRWSARWEHWLSVFDGMRRRQPPVNPRHLI